MQQIDRALDVNLRAPIVMAHALAPAMIARGGGHLLFMSSLSGKAATRRHRALQRDASSVCAASRWLCAPSCAPAASASRWSVPGFIRDAGMFAEAGSRSCLRASARAARRTSPARRPARSSATAREVDVAPLAVRVGAVFAGLAPELAATRHAQDRRRGDRRGDRTPVSATSAERVRLRFLDEDQRDAEVGRAATTACRLSGADSQARCARAT